MKNIIAIALLTLSQLFGGPIDCTAQQRSIPTFDYYNLWNICAREGRMPYNTSISASQLAGYNNSYPTITANSNVSTGTIFVPAGRVYLLQEIKAYASDSAHLTVTITNPANYQGTISPLMQLVSKQNPTATWSFPQPLFVHGGGTISVAYWRAGTTKGVYAGLNINAVDLTDDLNFGAEKVYANFSDSFGHLFSGTTGVTTYGNHYYPFLLRDSLIMKYNTSIRVVNKAYGAASIGLGYSRDITTASETSIVKLAESGWFDFNWDFATFSFGFNDASVSPAAWAAGRSQFKQNYAVGLDKLLLAAKKNKKPTARIYIVLPYPAHSSDANRNANLPDVRAAITEVLSSPPYSLLTQFKILNPVSAYINTDDNNYNATESPKTHLSPTGMKLLSDWLWTQIKNDSTALKLKTIAP